MNVFNSAINFAAPTTDGFGYIVNFTYDPTQGNLLLTVTIPVGRAVGGRAGFFLASYATANRENDGVYSINSVSTATPLPVSRMPRARLRNSPEPPLPVPCRNVS